MADKIRYDEFAKNVAERFSHQKIMHNMITGKEDRPATTTEVNGFLDDTVVRCAACGAQLTPKQNRGLMNLCINRERGSAALKMQGMAEVVIACQNPQCRHEYAEVEWVR